MRRQNPQGIEPFLRDLRVHLLYIVGQCELCGRPSCPERLTFVYVAWARDNKQVCSPLAFRNSPAARKDRECRVAF